MRVPLFSKCPLEFLCRVGVFIGFHDTQGSQQHGEGGEG